MIEGREWERKDGEVRVKEENEDGKTGEIKRRKERKGEKRNKIKDVWRDGKDVMGGKGRERKGR